jgi:hypothetical protein
VYTLFKQFERKQKMIPPIVGNYVCNNCKHQTSTTLDPTGSEFNIRVVKCEKCDGNMSYQPSVHRWPAPDPDKGVKY